MAWYLIQSKPRLESIALKNLNNQGYQCYLPMIKVEGVIQNKIEVKRLPLFPRYLFIKLDDEFSSKSWTPIRSTKGVSNLVKFGDTLAKIPDGLVEIIKAREFQEESQVEPLFKKGQNLKILEGPFAGFDSIYQGADAEMRIIVLLEFMRKPVIAHLNLNNVSILK
jgi:transcriptional antiterminator RfaH